MLAWSPGLRSTISADAKGGKTRHVPLSEGAKDILRSCDSFLRSAWVFPGLKDVAHPMDSRAFLRRSFEPGLRRAGSLEPAGIHSRIPQPAAVFWQGSISCR